MPGACSAALVLHSSPLFAQGKTPEDPQFKKVLTAVQEAVAQNAPEKVADLSNFPKFSWELPGLGDDLSRDTFLKNYQKIFTPEIKAKLATGKFHPTQNRDYALEWNKKTENYILIFERQTDGSYKFAGLAVGSAD